MFAEGKQNTRRITRKFNSIEQTQSIFCVLFGISKIYSTFLLGREGFSFDFIHIFWRCIIAICTVLDSVGPALIRDDYIPGRGGEYIFVFLLSFCIHCTCWSYSFIRSRSG